MGYNLTIIRFSNDPLSFEELVDATRSIGECSVDDANNKISINIGNEVLFIHLVNQTAFTNNVTSDQTIRKLVLLARALGGRLRGDEMETYREDGSSYTHPDDRNEVTGHEDRIAKLVWRRNFLTITKAVILLVIVVSVVIRALSN